MTAAARLKQALDEDGVFESEMPFRGFGVFLMLFGLAGLVLWGALLPKHPPDPLVHVLELVAFWSLAPFTLLGLLIALKADRLRLDFAAGTYSWQRGFFPKLAEQRGSLQDFQRLIVGRRPGVPVSLLLVRQADKKEHWLCSRSGSGDKWDQAEFISVATLLAVRLGVSFTDETLPPATCVEAAPARVLQPFPAAAGESLKWVNSGPGYELRQGETLFATLTVTGDDYAGRGTGVTATGAWDLERRVPEMVLPEFRIRQASTAGEWALLRAGLRERRIIQFPGGRAFKIVWTIGSARSAYDSEGVAVVRQVVHLLGTKVTVFRSDLPEAEPLMLLFAFIRFSGSEGG